MRPTALFAERGDPRDVGHMSDCLAERRADGPIRSWMHKLPGELMDARQALELRASGCRSTPRIVEPPRHRPALKADCDRRTRVPTFCPHLPTKLGDPV